MIEYLRGELLEKNLHHVVLVAGDVGYGLDISARTHAALPEVGREATLFVYTHVREDALLLFGFHESREREAFLTLNSVSGVGPSMALSVLSTLPPSDLAKAILESDVTAITKVKGVGKRTAERITHELKNAVKSAPWAAGADAESAPPSLLESPHARDAAGALINLGMREVEADRAVAAAIKTLGSEAPADQLIVEGLKHRQ